LARGTEARGTLARGALMVALGAVASVMSATGADAAAPQREAFELPGRVVASAALPEAGVVLAVLADDGALSLWRVDGADGAVRPRAYEVALPPDLARLPPDERASPHVDLQAIAGGGGRAPGLLVARPGSLWLLAEGAAQRLLAEPGFAPAEPARATHASLMTTASWPLAFARAGELMLLDATAAPVRVDLPLEARPRPWGLELGSPPVRRLAAPLAGTVVVVGPQKVGDRRLRTLLVDAAGAVTEAWSLLPAGERLLAGYPLALDGELLLAVTAAPKGMLAEQRLHLFRLGADRSRHGSAPRFSTQLQVRHWDSPDLVPGDRDGDGRDDLVVLEPRGLGGGELTVSIFRGTGGGRLSFAGKRVGWGEGRGQRSYGADLTGDGRADLVRLAKKQVMLHAGEAGDRAVRSAAEWSVTLGGAEERRVLTIGAGSSGEGGANMQSEGRRGEQRGEGDRRDRDARDENDGFGSATLAVHDLDGDGVAEVLLWRQRDAGGSELQVLRRR
jgi:hypothetical protein